MPFLGLCLGFQMAVVEFSRNVLGWADATSEEFGEGRHVIAILPEQEHVSQLGGTMRLGNYPVTIRDNTMAKELFGCNEIQERHRHRYEVDPGSIEALEKAGIVFSDFMGQQDGDPRNTDPPVLLRHPVPPRIQVASCTPGTAVPRFRKGLQGTPEPGLIRRRTRWSIHHGSLTKR